MIWHWPNQKESVGEKIKGGGRGAGYGGQGED